MSLTYLSHDPTVTPMLERLKKQEEQRHQANKDKVRELLIRHQAEDLIPMILENVEY